MLMGWRLRTTFDLLILDLKAKVQAKQQREKNSHDQGTKMSNFKMGDEVYIRNYSYGPKWLLAVIKNCTGPVSYSVAIGNGQNLHHHVDQIRARYTNKQQTWEPEQTQG